MVLCRTVFQSDFKNGEAFLHLHFRAAALNFGIFYSFRTYPQKDVFFEYCLTKSELYDLNIRDDSDDISYSKERQELIVHYKIPEDYITVKKDEINGIKVTYIAKNTEESKND